MPEQKMWWRGATTSRGASNAPTQAPIGGHRRQMIARRTSSGSVRFDSRTDVEGQIGPVYVILHQTKRNQYRDPANRMKFASLKVKHAEWAKELANLAALALDTSLQRPKVSTGRLRAAIIDPRNRTSDYTMFAVGDPTWMDESDAGFYWRSIEEGTSFFLGRKIQGVWGSQVESGFGGQGEYGPYPLAQGNFTAFNRSSNQGRLRPYTAPRTKAIIKGIKRDARLANAESAVRGTGKTDRNPVFRGTIERPIRPHSYYAIAWRRFDPLRKANAIAALVMNDIKKLVFPSI